MGGGGVHIPHSSLQTGPSVEAPGGGGGGAAVGAPSKGEQVCQLVPLVSRTLGVMCGGVPLGLWRDGRGVERGGLGGGGEVWWCTRVCEWDVRPTAPMAACPTHIV